MSYGQIGDMMSARKRANLWCCTTRLRTWTEKDVVEPNDFGKSAVVEAINAVLYWAESFVSDDGESLYAFKILSAVIVEHANPILNAAKVEVVLEQGEMVLGVVFGVALVYGDVYVFFAKVIYELEEGLGKVGKEVLRVVKVDSDEDSLVALWCRSEVGETTTWADGECPPSDGAK